MPAGVGELQRREIALQITPPQQIQIEGAGPPVFQPLAAKGTLQLLQTCQEIQSSGGSGGKRHLGHHSSIQIIRLAGGAAHWCCAEQWRPSQPAGLRRPALEQLRQKGAYRHEGVERTTGGTGQVGAQANRQLRRGLGAA